MLTVEDIERQQRIRRRIVRGTLYLLLVVMCITIGWLISRIGYDDIDHQSRAGRHTVMAERHDIALRR